MSPEYIKAEVNPDRERSLMQLVLDNQEVYQATDAVKPPQVGDFLVYGDHGINIGLVMTGFTKSLNYGLQPAFKPAWAIKDERETYLAFTPHYHNRDIKLIVHSESQGTGVIPIEIEDLEPHFLPTQFMKVYRIRDKNIQKAQNAFLMAQQFAIWNLRLAALAGVVGMGGAIYQYITGADEGSILLPGAFGGLMGYLLTRAAIRDFDQAIKERDNIRKYLAHYSPYFHNYFISG